jgi:hypothetical protein
MCRALKVLCAAPDAERLAELKRATVSVNWELVGGAISVEDLARQARVHHPDVVVVDAALGRSALAAVVAVRPEARIVTLGQVAGAQAVASSLEDIRDAILDAPRSSGPVTR